MSTTEAPLFSIVVCSIDPSRLRAVENNIASTIGDDISFEFIGLDNRNPSRPLAQVYNRGARQSRGKYLLFIHEDAGFGSKDWGKEIAEKLEEPTTGVIGFAGSTFIPDAPGGWNTAERFTVWRMSECGVPRSLNIDPDSDFTEVKALDGFALFVRKDVWKEFPFDEANLKGFHCYDMDFTLTVGTRYRNYVSARVDAFHNSTGNFGRDWLIATGEMYLQKWNPSCLLPAILPPDKNISGEISEKEKASLRERVWWRYLKALRKNGLSLRRWIKPFVSMPLTGKHPGHLLRLLFHL